MNPPFIDIHTHRIQESRPDVYALSNVIISKDKLPSTSCSVGIHPYFIEADLTAQLRNLEYELSKPQVLALGECGLDKIRGTSFDRQILAFEAQISLAKKFSKPLIIHCVKAYQEILGILKNQQVPGPIIFHGYAKGIQLARQITERGHYLSLGYASLQGKHDDLIRAIDLSQVFLETDDKAISITDIYTYFCRTRNIEISVLKQQIKHNFDTVFNTK